MDHAFIGTVRLSGCLVPLVLSRRRVYASHGPETIRPKRSLVHQNTAQDVNGRIGYHFIWLQSTCKADVGCGALPAFHLKERVNPGEFASSFGIGILGIMILLILMVYIVRTLRAP